MIRAPARNLELKVHCGPDGIADVRSRIERAGLPIGQRLRQTDTYYRVSRGRLKLRLIEDLADAIDGDAGEHLAELIGYERPRDEGSRWSSYVVAQINPAAADGLQDALALTHEVTSVVRKQRDIALWGATRIHLDVVDGLGSFIELETVITAQPDDVAVAEHRLVIERLGLGRWPVISGSYSDIDCE